MFSTTLAKSLPVVLIIGMLLVVTVTPISLVLIQSDDVSISHVLWDSTFPPAQAEELVELVELVEDFRTSAAIPSLLFCRLGC